MYICHNVCVFSRTSETEFTLFRELRVHSDLNYD